MQQFPEEHQSRDQLTWFQRNGFPEWLVAVVWIFTALIIFQVIGGLFAVTTILLTEGADGLTADELFNRLDLLILGNSVGQILGLGLATLLVAKLATIPGNYRRFMRFRMPAAPVATFGFAIALIFVVQPLIWFLGWANQLIPMPDFVLEMEESQARMLTNLLTGGFALWFLVFNVGVVPAICEEIMFRSFLHRLFENALGIGAALVVTGVVFGLFHLSLTQLLPLSAIGILLGYITVKSGSVYPAMVMHFLHNSGTVTAVHTNPELLDVAEAAAMPQLWLVLTSLVLTVYLIFLLRRDTPSIE